MIGWMRGRRFTVLADDKLTAFLELHAAIHRQLQLKSEGRAIWIVDAHRDDGRRLLYAPTKS
jgi:hypothetical protein